jgi:hypothetical protein
MHRRVGRLPTYFYSLNGRRASSGLSDFIVSIKRELPAPCGVNLSATGGLGFPTGASKISSHGYDTILTFNSHGRTGSATTGHSKVCSLSHGSRANTQAILPSNRAFVD